MNSMLEISFAVVGLIIGSFTNVLIHRFPKGESVVWPGSHCPSCKHRLRTVDLVPVLSFLFLKGRCRYCRAPISRQYPLVEILSAAGYWLVYRYYGLSIESLAGCVLVTILLCAAFTDLQTGLIPDRLTYPGILAGLALAWFTIGLQSALLGSLGFAVLFFVIAVASRGGMGGGDIKLAGVIGAFIGWQGALVTFVLASLLGGLAAGYLLARGQADRKSAIRFGPYLALGAFITLIWGKQIVAFYLSTL
jgi:leader peptidase (prepilin peptidase)/N-methyltransferase